MISTRIFQPQRHMISPGDISNGLQRKGNDQPLHPLGQHRRVRLLSLSSIGAASRRACFCIAQRYPGIWSVRPCIQGVSLHKTCNTNEPVGSGALREGVQEADDGDEQFGWEASDSVGWHRDTA